jgi:putative acetyltransferase
VQLPGEYGAARGDLLLALGATRTAGCVALRPLSVDPAFGEVRRLYVHPSARGSGLGRELMTTLIASARRIGYHELRLETLLAMTTAQALYRALGFTPCDSYRATDDNNASDVQTMRLSLT